MQGKPPIRNDLMVKAFNLRSAGLKRSQISELTGLSLGFLSKLFLGKVKYFNYTGYTIEAGSRPNEGNILRKKYQDRFLELYHKKVPIIQIGREFGLTYQQVNRLYSVLYKTGLTRNYKSTLVVEAPSVEEDSSQLDLFDPSITIKSEPVKAPDDSPRDPIALFKDDYVRLYNDGLSTKDIVDQLGLTDKEFEQIKSYAYSRGLLKYRRNRTSKKEPTLPVNESFKKEFIPFEPIPGSAPVKEPSHSVLREVKKDNEARDRERLIDDICRLFSENVFISTIALTRDIPSEEVRAILKEEGYLNDPLSNI